MELLLKRIFVNDKYCIGKLHINGIYFCDTLEDPPREVKIAGITGIPTGTYQVILNMSNRFKRIMPLVVNVPGFEGIRIHSGNTEVDTEGCVLVGKNTVKGKLTDSRLIFKQLFTVLTNTTEKIWITVQ